MVNNGYFMSPRSDLTIRNLTAEQIEAISNAAVDIVGGVVSFSESAIYESEDTTAVVPNWCHTSSVNNCAFVHPHIHGAGCSVGCVVCHGKPLNG